MSKTIRSGIASAILVALVLAVYLWVFSDYNQGASAQEVVGGACAKMEATTDYDVVGTRLRTTDGYAVPPRKYEAKISGKDYHVKTSNQDGSDMVEAIWLDGISYRKYHDYENQWYIDLTPLLVSEASRVQLPLQHTPLATCLSTSCGV